MSGSKSSRCAQLGKPFQKITLSTGLIPLSFFSSFTVILPFFLVPHEPEKKITESNLQKKMDVHVSISTRTFLDYLAYNIHA
uniref:Uncharacterized protein n=1 Tax=Rhizophora mucronata TaxID=61149 RepID=A0A2P2N4H3_RHIMU